MLILTLALTVALGQQSAETSKPEVPILKANLGSCSAEFSVEDTDGSPVYAAAIHVRVRYGLWGIKRADLEVGTDSDGKARIEGLPEKAKPLVYDIQKADKKAVVEQHVAENCQASYTVSLE